MSGERTAYDNHGFGSLGRSAAVTAQDARESFRTMESMADYVSHTNDPPGQLPHVSQSYTEMQEAMASYDNEADLDEESFRSDLERDSAHSSLVQAQAASGYVDAAVGVGGGVSVPAHATVSRSMSHNQRHEMLLREANRRASLQYTSGIKTSISRQPLMETSFEDSAADRSPVSQTASEQMVNPAEIALTIPEDSEAERQGMGRVIERPKTAAMGRRDLIDRRSRSGHNIKASSTSEIAVINPTSHEEIQPASSASSSPQKHTAPGSRQQHQPQQQLRRGSGLRDSRHHKRSDAVSIPPKQRSYQSPSRKTHAERQSGLYQRPQKPKATLSNLFGLIDTGKLEGLLGGGSATAPGPGLQLELVGQHHPARRCSVSGPERDELEAALSPEERAHLAREKYEEVLKETEKHRGKQDALFYGSVCGFIAGLLLLMSFASPYWLVSWEDTQSPFKNMGLWEFCFYKFRHPDYQFDKLYTGCHALYGTEYRLIREKLLPGWLMVVQFFITMAFIFSFVGQMVQAALLLRMPLEPILRFEYHFCGLAFILHGCTAVLMFLGVLIFGCCCWARDWLLYPNYNYVSWSYAFAVISCLIHIFAALFMLKDYKDARERKERNKALIMQMHPPGFSSAYHMGGSGFI